MNKEKDNKNIIDDNNLNDVSGGGLLSSYSDNQYESAGVEIIGAGFLYNDGYKFKGKEISTSEAESLVEFYFDKGFVASSVQEAVDYVEEKRRQKRDYFIPE